MQTTLTINQSSISSKNNAKANHQNNTIIIGSDESLKGDTFGGIVVAAVKTTSTKEQQRLISLGVKDSKQLKDTDIQNIAKVIKSEFECNIISLLPHEYNSKSGNVTSLLNDLHKRAAKDLKPGHHIVDEYPGCTVGDLHEQKAESKYIEVAAASILARSAALDQIHFLSSLAGFTIPKGSTHVKDALQKLKEKKLPPSQFVKLDFKNVKEIFK